MNNKFVAFIIAIVVTLSGVALTLYSQRDREKEIKGASTEILTAQVVETNENQSSRKFNLDALLIGLGRSVDLSIVEIIDASILWKTTEADYEVLGKSITIPNITDVDLNKINSALAARGFTLNEKNTYASGETANVGFILEDNVCLLRKKETKDEANALSSWLEIRCGTIDYDRVIDNPSIL